MIYGLDYLGGANYGELIVREHPSGWAAGFILNTNAPHWPKKNAWMVIEKLLDTGRCPRLRVHAVWDDAHRYNPKNHDPIIMRELKKARAISERFPNVEVQFSPFCEHNIKGAELKTLFSKIVPHAGALRLVNCVYQGDVLDWVTNEVHGSHKKPASNYNYSFDGTACVDADVERTKAAYGDAETFYFWTSQFNGRLNPNDKTPRNLRQAWPTSDLIDSVIYLYRMRGATKLPKKSLWKSHADQHSVPKPEPRALKPVFITPHDAKRVELVADNGQVVAVLPRSSNFTDGRPLYRLDQFGYQVAEKARRIQGHSVLKVRINGKVIGAVNPAFRCNDYR